MSFDANGLLDLWTRPIADEEAARAAFAGWYMDPVTINGAPMALADLVRRAGGLQAAFETLTREVESVIESGDRIVLSFRMGGRQVGPLATSAGVLSPTHRLITLRVIDILILREGLITDITMVADELGGLAAVGAASLTGAPAAG